MSAATEENVFNILCGAILSCRGFKETQSQHHTGAPNIRALNGLDGILDTAGLSRISELAMNTALLFGVILIVIAVWG